MTRSEHKARRAGIEAPSGLMRHEHGRSPVQLACNDNLLLVAAGKPRDEGRGAGRTNIIFHHQLSRLSQQEADVPAAHREHKATDRCRAA